MCVEHTGLDISQILVRLDVADGVGEHELLRMGCVRQGRGPHSHRVDEVSHEAARELGSIQQRTAGAVHHRKAHLGV